MFSIRSVVKGEGFRWTIINTWSIIQYVLQDLALSTLNYHHSKLVFHSLECCMAV